MAGTDASGVPDTVLPGLCWSFRGGTYADRDAFDRKVRQYQIDTLEKDCWAPQTVVLPCPRVRVAFMYWQGDDQLDGLLELVSDDGAGFTALELLFKIHNAVVGPLQGDNHCFFEGLGLHSNQAAGKPPLYVLGQGSRAQARRTRRCT